MFSMNLICLAVLAAVFTGIVIVGYDVIQDIIPDIKEIFSNTAEDE